MMLFRVTGTGFARTREPVDLGRTLEVLESLTSHAVQIAGHIREKLDPCIDSRIMVQDVASMVNVFENHTEPVIIMGSFTGSRRLPLHWVVAIRRVPFYGSGWKKQMRN